MTSIAAEREPTNSTSPESVARRAFGDIGGRCKGRRAGRVQVCMAPNFEILEEVDGGRVRYRPGEISVTGWTALEGGEGEVTITMSAFDGAGNELEHAGLSISPAMAGVLVRMLDRARAAAERPAGG